MTDPMTDPVTDPDPAVEVWRCAWTERVRTTKRYATDRPLALDQPNAADFDTEQAATDWALSLALVGPLVGEATIYPIPIVKETA